VLNGKTEGFRKKRYISRVFVLFFFGYSRWVAKTIESQKNIPNDVIIQKQDFARLGYGDPPPPR
jgi:hypothetical protein